MWTPPLHLPKPNSSNICCRESFSVWDGCQCPTLSSLDALSGSSLMSLYIGCLDSDRQLRWAIFGGTIFFTSDLGPFFIPCATTEEDGEKVTV